MTDLGRFPKQSSEHALAFRPCIRIQLATIAAFAICTAIALAVIELRQMEQRYQVAERI